MRFLFGILAALVVAAPIYGSPMASPESKDGDDEDTTAPMNCKVGLRHPCLHDGYTKCCADGGYAKCKDHFWEAVACGRNEFCVHMNDKDGKEDKHHVECKIRD
jgi:hypothetical protein